MNATPASDGQWIREAVRRFEVPLTLYAARIVGDADRGRDVVQDAFVRLCGQAREDVEPRLAEWLYTVCRNRALDVRRKESRMAPLTEVEAASRPATAPPAGDAAETREVVSAAVRALETLPPNQQEVLRLKFQHALSYKEIAAVTGLSVSNVGFLIHTGLKVLRGQMEEFSRLK